jgi:hypothetical protein
MAVLTVFPERKEEQTLAETDDQTVLETEHSTHGHTTLQNKIL